MEILVDGSRIVILACLVLGLGVFLSDRLPFLRRYGIPVAVTGGLLCAVGVALLEATSDFTVTFDMSLRNSLLLMFFSTIGLSARLSTLKQGGRLLALLLGATIAFLVLQNTAGVLAVMAMGYPPSAGLIGGSISLAGGHGTAITWGQLAADAGYPGATAIGIAFATFGLIAGGVVGSPTGMRLIRRFSLRSEADVEAEPQEQESSTPERGRRVTTRSVIVTIFLLAVCTGIGSELNRIMSGNGIVLPGFLTAMGTGIVLSNLLAWRGIGIDESTTKVFNDVSLHLFLAMSLMSLSLTDLAGSSGPILVVLTIQVATAVLFGTFIVFRLAGRDYDAAVITAGFVGLGLGATPVGVANMNALTSRFGPSPQAFLVVPLIGAFFLDIANAFVIQFFLSQPGMSL